MTADARRTTREDSRRAPWAERLPAGPVLTRTALAAAGAIGALLLGLATVLTVIQITVGTVTELEGQETAFSGFDRHGPALLLLAGVAGLMLAGAVRGARPAMAAVAALGACALLLAIVQDLPAADETGRIGDLYSDASAGVASGFWVELAGGGLLVACGVGLLLTSGRAARPGRRARAAEADGPA